MLPVSNNCYVPGADAVPADFWAAEEAQCWAVPACPDRQGSSALWNSVPIAAISPSSNDM
jgi:hypothetical protein